MPRQRTAQSIYEDFLKNFLYTFTYFPTTNWQRAFSPTLYFGCNVEDADVEQHVLDEVGSYGKQLNRVLDVLTVLVGRIDRNSLTPQERRFVDEFEDLAQRADEVAAAYQGKRPHGITQTDVNHMIDGLRSLAGSDYGHNQEVLGQIFRALPPASAERQANGAPAPAKSG
jgi:hypothetical protein